MKIVVTGANGQLGSEIKHLPKVGDDHYIYCDIDEMDLSKPESIKSYLSEVSPDLIISCGAYTAVDKAEDEVELATKINSEAPKEIAIYCKNNGCRLIHISTDYVFDGKFDRPITEKDEPNPQSIYGQTKLDGEKAIQSILDNAYIIRTAWVYSSFGNNFVKTMLRLGAEREELNVVSDQFGTPTWARDLANVILTIITEINKGNDQPGIYHYSNDGAISWFDFAVEIMKLKNIACKINSITTSEYPTRAERPRYSVLSKERINKCYSVHTSKWKESLQRCLELI